MHLCLVNEFKAYNHYQLPKPISREFYKTHRQLAVSHIFFLGFQKLQYQYKMLETHESLHLSAWVLFRHRTGQCFLRYRIEYSYLNSHQNVRFDCEGLDFSEEIPQ